jgi:hypothetical protein
MGSHASPWKAIKRTRGLWESMQNPENLARSVKINKILWSCVGSHRSSNQWKAVEPVAARKFAGTKDAAGAVWDPMAVGTSENSRSSVPDIPVGQFAKHVHKQTRKTC